MTGFGPGMDRARREAGYRAQTGLRAGVADRDVPAFIDAHDPVTRAHLLGLTARQRRRAEHKENRRRAAARRVVVAADTARGVHRGHP